MSQFNEEEFFSAIDQICEEKKLAKDKVIETIEAALAVAYRKDYGRPQMEIKAKMGPGGLNDVAFFIVRDVIADEDEIKDELTQIHLSEAKEIDPTVEIEGKTYTATDTPENFGRIAAQTAKQVIIQRLREAERDNIFDEFKGKEKSIVSGIVQRIEGQNVFIDLGPAIGVMLPDGRIPGEHYNIGQRLKFYLDKVDNTPKGAQILLSRSHPDFIRQLFTLEIPEIDLGSVEIKSIARDAGIRAKVAVHANQEGVDPIGSCVGQKGTRVQAIINEIGDEKIDIVLWNEDPIVFIKHALAPAKIAKVVTDHSRQTAVIYVESEQQSLAIGRGGQNVKLASRLTGWKLDIIEASKEVLAKLQEEEAEQLANPVAPIKPEITEEMPKTEVAIPEPFVEETPAIEYPVIPLENLKLSKKLHVKLLEAGYDEIAKLATANIEQLTAINGIGQTTAEKIQSMSKEALEQSNQ